MFCSKCGNENPGENQFCARCGQALNAANAAGQVEAGSGNAQVAPPPLFTGEAITDGKAMASLILGVLALTVLWILAGIPAIILGHMSRSSIKKSLGRLKGEGMALAGLIMGYLSVAALPFILIIAAIAIPNFLRARISANESAAVANIRTINTAAVTYLASNERQEFAATLKDMGPDSGPDGKAANLITGELANGVKSGYHFIYTPSDSDGDQKLDAYFVLASPVTPGTTGMRSFCSDQSGVIRVAARNEECTNESPAL